MNVDEAQRRLEAGGLAVERTRLGNDTGYQLRCKTGEIVNVFDKGTLSFQGKNQPQARQLLGVDAGADAVHEAPGPASRKVFVVYGHDATTRTQLEAMLRRWGSRSPDPRPATL
jgi:predicted nucleotide-binding protein